MLLRLASVFLFGSHFGWYVGAFQVQGVTAVGLHFAFVCTAAFNAFELAGATHKTPASRGLVGRALDGSLTHGAHSQLFPGIKRVHFKTVLVLDVRSEE